MLSKKQIKQFKDDGFIKVPSLFSKEEVELISKYTDELKNSPEVSDREWKYYEDGKLNDDRIICRIENFCKYHTGFNDLSSKGKLIDCVNDCFGEKGILFKDKINFKMPGGAGFTPHQDSQAGWEDYAKFFLTAMVCIDETTLKNGCLEFAAGHNKSGLIGEEFKPLTLEDMKNMDFKPIPTKPGDAAFFDCYAPHRSEPNMTNTPRRILLLTYNKLSDGDHREDYYIDKFKNYPPDIDRDSNKNYSFKV